MIALQSLVTIFWLWPFWDIWKVRSSIRPLLSTLSAKRGTFTLFPWLGNITRWWEAKQNNRSSMFLLFITFRCGKMMHLWHHFACSCILVGREVSTWARYLFTKRGRNKKVYLSSFPSLHTQVACLLHHSIYLHPHQNTTACKVTSRAHRFVTAESNKKAEAYYYGSLCFSSNYLRAGKVERIH